MQQRVRRPHAMSRSANATRVVLVEVVLAGVGGCTGTTSSPTPASATALSTPEPSPTVSSPSAETAASAGSAHDIPAEIARRLDLALGAGERYEQLIESFIVTVDGTPIYEHYSADSVPDVTHNGYSVTKSVMSMLIGIAIDEGSIAGVDQTLAELLPSYVPTMAPGVADVTLK